MAPRHWERVKKIKITTIDVTSATPLFRNQYPFITSTEAMLECGNLLNMA